MLVLSKNNYDKDSLEKFNLLIGFKKLKFQN